MWQLLILTLVSQSPFLLPLSGWKRKLRPFSFCCWQKGMMYEWHFNPTIKLAINGHFHYFFWPRRLACGVFMDVVWSVGQLVCLSVGPSIGWSVGWLVFHSVCQSGCVVCLSVGLSLGGSASRFVCQSFCDRKFYTNYHNRYLGTILSGCEYIHYFTNLGSFWNVSLRKRINELLFPVLIVLKYMKILQRLWVAQAAMTECWPWKED